MIPSVVVKLLQKIHFYYPIGLTNIQNVYPGIKLIREKIFKKMNEIQNNADTPWKAFVHKVKAEFTYYKISDLGHLQFPNYLLNITVEEREDKEILKNLEVVAVVSLLINFYTIFIKKETTYISFNIKESGDVFPECLIIYNESNVENELFNVIDFLKVSLSEYFPRHKFLQHKILFDYKVKGGVPYGYEDELFEPFNIFSYLFSNDLIHKKYFLLD